MSDKCGNCDCADKTQCVKGNSFVVDVVVEQSYTETMAMDENSNENGKCKCGSSCSCTNCTCGSH